MEVLIEEVSVGALIAGRIVLQQNCSSREVARMHLSRADWQDFSRCLGYPKRIRRGAIVFSAAADSGQKENGIRLPSGTLGGHVDHGTYWHSVSGSSQEAPRAEIMVAVARHRSLV